MVQQEPAQSSWNVFLENLDGYAFALIAAYAVYRFADPIATHVIPRLSRLKVGGLEVETEALWRDMNTAANSAEAHNALSPIDVQSTVKKPVKIASADRERVIARALARAEIFRHRRILWVDDNPDNNALEQSILRRLGVDIVKREDNDSALSFLGDHGASCDVVISDIDRGSAPSGLEMLEEYRAGEYKMPLIFYVSIVDASKPVPVGAFGLTNRPDELLHLVTDALERRFTGYSI